MSYLYRKIAKTAESRPPRRPGWGWSESLWRPHAFAAFCRRRRPEWRQRGPQLLPRWLLSRLCFRLHNMSWQTTHVDFFNAVKCSQSEKPWVYIIERTQFEVEDGFIFQIVYAQFCTLLYSWFVNITFPLTSKRLRVLFFTLRIMNEPSLLKFSYIWKKKHYKQKNLYCYKT